MGAVREKADLGKAILRREATPPLPTAIRRPCSVVGFAVAMVFLAAMLDAALWHNGYQRQELESDLGAAAAEIQHLEAQNKELRLENLSLELRLLERDLTSLEARDEPARSHKVLIATDPKPVGPESGGPDSH